MSLKFEESKLSFYFENNEQRGNANIFVTNCIGKRTKEWKTQKERIKN